MMVDRLRVWSGHSSCDGVGGLITGVVSESSSGIARLRRSRGAEGCREKSGDEGSGGTEVRVGLVAVGCPKRFIMCPILLTEE